MRSVFTGGRTTSAESAARAATAEPAVTYAHSRTWPRRRYRTGTVSSPVAGGAAPSTSTRPAWPSGAAGHGERVSSRCSRSAAGLEPAW